MGRSAHFSKLVGLSSVARKDTRVDLEGKIVVRRQLGGAEPPQLADVVGRLWATGDDVRRPVEVQRRRRVVALPVDVHLDRDELERLDLEPGLLAQLTDDRIAWMLALLEESAGQVPLALVGRPGSPAEQDAAVIGDDDGARGRLRVRVAAESAAPTVDAAVAVLECRAAPRAPSPRMEHAH